MASEELLLVLVMQILNHKQAPDIVNNRVLINRMKVDSVLELSIVADGVLQL